ncbi:MAG: PadR family transcriptional regulator [Dermatophilaceae bacterium]
MSNPLALAVLSCLAERPMHPYQISTTLRTRGKERSIKLNYGSLYSVVESLQRHGLIEPKETIRDGRRPERTVYAITPAGYTEFEDWLSELLSVPTREFTSLEAALSLMGGLPPDQVARLLEERVARLTAELRSEQAALDVAREQGVPEVFLVESHLRLAMVTAETQFVTTLVHDVRTGELPGTAAWGRLHELVAAGIPVEEIFADPVRHLGEEARAFDAAPPGP